MKILFILPEYYPHSGGGISTYYLNYIKALVPFCEKIKVIVGSGYFQNDYKIKHEGIDVEGLSPEIFRKYIEKFKQYDLFPEYQKNLAAAWAIYEQSENGRNYDIIECTDFGLGYIPWIINHDRPVITRLHGSEGQIEIFEPNLNNHINGNINRLTELALLSKSDKLVTHSTNNQRYWQKIFPEKKIELIYPTFSPRINEVCSFEYRSSFAIVCGRIQQWKGPDVLCSALSHLKNNVETMQWFGRDTKYNETQSKSQHLAENFPLVWNKKVLVKAAIANEDLMQVQQNTKFGIIPSTWDMFNFTCIEFLSNGTPVICSESAGVSDLIIDGLNGFKYKNNDSIELSECIEKAKNLTENQYMEMANAAVSTILKKLSPSVTIPHNVRLYKNAVEKELLNTTNSFIEKTFKPSDSIYSLYTTLDQQPIKKIINYLVKRIINK